MALQMRNECGRCHAQVAPGGEACICVFERTFRAGCADSMRQVCPDGGGGRVRRPRSNRAHASGPAPA